MDGLKILVTGSGGLVGDAISSLSYDFPEYNFYFATREEGDLTKENNVANLYEKVKPDYVIHAAAKVGGVMGNMSGHADFFYENILMNTYMLHYACKHKVKKFLAFSSVCVFPSEESVVNESMMLEGHPFPANFAYGWSKRMIDVMISAYKNQHDIGECYSSIIPGNIFGPNDQYNLRTGHVLPSLMHKIYLAKQNKEPLRVWGNGSSGREFIFSLDLATIIFKLLKLDKLPQRIIISGDQQFTIKEMVDKLCAIAKFTGDVIWETDKPNGQGSRSSDLTLLRSLVDVKYTDIDVALGVSYSWFEDNYPNVRM